EDEIRAAEAEQTGGGSLDLSALGLTEKQVEKYTAAVEAARIASETELGDRVMEEYRRELKKTWKEERARVREEVAAAINREPASLAYSVLTRGKMPDGGEVPDDVGDRVFPEGVPLKLDRRALEEEYQTRPEYQDLLKRLPRPAVYAKEGGV